MKRYFAILLLAGCATKKEVRSVTDATGTSKASNSATETRAGTKVSRQSDVLQTGPVTTETTTTVETFSPDGGVARKIVRSVHRVAAPSSEVKEQSTAEVDSKETQRAAELNEVRARLAKTDLQQSSKPSLGIGVRILLLVAALAVVAVAVFRKYLAERFGWLSWLVRK